MSDPNIRQHLESGVLTLRIHRPQKKNALTKSMYAALARALSEGAENSAVRVVLLTGSEGVFTSGNDVNDFLMARDTSEDSPVAKFMRELAAFPKPVVASVAGLAIGIGVTMLLHCDLIYAGRETRLQMPFVNIGICPEFASSYLLPRIMGHARAAELILFGDPFSAKQAQEYGLVNAVVDDENVEAYALERAQRLARQAPNALRTSKALLKRWSAATVDEAMPVEAEHFGPMLRQAEALEAMAAFVEKRSPDFSKL